MRVRCPMGLLLGLFSLPALAQTLPYFITDGDSNTAYIIQNGVLQGTFDTSQVNIGYPPAVGDTVLIADREDAAAAEYSLGGVFTGATFSGGTNFDEMLDGGTDGALNNYACRWGNAPSNDVIRTGPDWNGGASLFTLTFDMTGCTYDTATNTVWVIDDGTATGPTVAIRQFDMLGNELFSFDPGLGGRLCCLAYDQPSDTLWFTHNQLPNGKAPAGRKVPPGSGSGRGSVNKGGDRTIYEYSKAGAQLDAILINGFSPDNIWGGEMPIFAQVAVPALNTWGMVILLLGLGTTVALILRRRRRTV